MSASEPTTFDVLSSRYGLKKPGYNYQKEIDYETMVNDEPMVKRYNKESFKIYQGPFGKEYEYKGYTNFALDELFKQYAEDDIFTDSDSPNDIFFIPDIFILKENKYILVRGYSKFNKHRSYMIDRYIEFKKQGINYEIWIYNSYGDKIECYL